MGASLIPVLFFTIVWGVVGGILPFLIPASPHKSVIQVIRKNMIAIVIIYNYFTWKFRIFYFSCKGSQDHFAYTTSSAARDVL